MEGRSAKALELMSRTVWVGFFVEEDPSWQCSAVRLRKSQELIWSLQDPGSGREGSDQRVTDCWSACPSPERMWFG